ncbi:hypothetical protein GYMLUDRAFT_135904, partial [Collybiopsis luxurians FD-317 M1]
MHLNIKWGKERTSYQVQDPSIPLSDLKIFVAEWTHLPLDSLKLIHSGAIMKDDNAPLSSYRLRPNTTIQVVGSAVPSSGGPTPKSETSITSQIHEQLASVRSNLVPSLETFLSSLSTAANPDTTLPVDSLTKFGPLQKEQVRLSELFLQSLLNLDAITVDKEWEQARQERKAAVKEVQGYLDQLD